MRTETETSRASEEARPASLSPVQTSEIQHQLNRVLASELFTKSPQLSRFLRFCIDRVLLGRQDELKEQVLGVEVFRRSASFDPRIDPIVRVEARRLRAKLEDYYATTGRFDQLVIYFQRGDYVPRFAHMTAAEDKTPAAALSARVLIVEDERLVAKDLENRLKSLGYSVVGSAATGEGAVKSTEQHHPDLVLMDIALSGPMRGTEAAKRIWQRWHTPVVYLTAFSDAMVLEDVRGAEPYGYVLKPFEPRQLHAVLQLALSRRANELAETAALREQSRTDALLSAMETACIEAWEWTVKDDSGSWPEAVERSADRLLPDSDDDPPEFFSRIAPADRERVRAAFNRALSEQCRIEIGYRRTDGNGVPGFAVATGVSVRDDAGHVRLSGLEVGIPSEAQRHTVAATAVREQHDFIRGAEQELRSAIQGVTGYLQLLEQRKRDHDPVTRSVLDEMETGTQRLRDLLERVERYGRSFPGELAESKHVSLDAALDTALLALRSELAEAKAEVTREPLPTIAASGSDFAQVFENLLANAVECRRPDKPLRVHVSATGQDRTWTITVRDNGRGFDPAEAERIFRPFEPQGGADAPPAGVGLAITRRIIEAHGGNIQAESVAGEGSVFRFTLPHSSANG